MTQDHFAHATEAIPDSLKFTRSEVDGYVIDVLTGKLTPQQWKSGKWYLALGPVAIECDPADYNTEERARLIIEELEPYVVDDEWDDPLPDEEPDPPADPAQLQLENEAADPPAQPDMENDAPKSEPAPEPFPVAQKHDDTQTSLAAHSREVREFFSTLTAQAKAATKHIVEEGRHPELLQMILVHPADEKVSGIYRYELDDPELIERMTGEAISASEGGHNVYIEGRTVRRSLGAKVRGVLEDTVAVFALVVDSDNDKGKAWSPTVPVSLTVETSPGNRHFWLFLEIALDPATAQKLGARLRAATNADDDTGNVCQPYRVAGTTNYPSKKKLERGRIITGTRTLSFDPETLWTPARLEQEFPATTRTPTNSRSETQAPPPEDLGNYKVAEGFTDLPIEDLGVNLTLDSVYPPEQIAALRALGYTDKAIWELTPKQARKLIGADPELIAAALAVIPHNHDDPHSENYWKEIEQTPGRKYNVQIGMAVKAASNGSAEGLVLFDKWRSGAPDYDANTVKKKWDGFHPTSIGFGTLSFYADKAAPGWREEYEAQIESPPKNANRRGLPGFDVSGGDTTPQPKQKLPLLVELGSKLWGPATLSGNEYRFGVDQSKVIDQRRGAWFDFATNEGGFIKDLMKNLNAAANHVDTPPLVCVDISKWIDAAVPQREWAVLNRIPAKNVTVLSGTGGIGKTILAQQLAASTILSREWFNVVPDQGPVIFVSGEEDEEEMHRRFADIVQHLNVSFQDLIDGGLHLIDKAGRNAMLACPSPKGLGLITTPFLKQLSALAQHQHPKLVILDNRNMVYGGNINDPTQVSDFINTMRGFAIDANTAVVLILHPSLAGMGAATDSSHQGLAGVMNWHDMPRGRMFFSRIKTEEDKEIDKDLRSLVCKKNNYGPDDETIIVRWKTGTNGSGVFVMEPKPGSLEAMAENKKVEEIFLSSLQRLTNQNRGPFSHKKRSHNYAPTALADLPEVKKAGIKKTALANAMDRLIEIKKITIESYGPPSKDHTKLVIADDPAMDKLAAILTAWKAAIDTNAPRTLQYVIEMANPRINPELNAALLAVAAMDDGTTISNTLLTQWLQKHHRLPANGLMLSSDDGNKWTLIAPFLPTRAIREQLRQCGLNEDDIAKLTSLQQAQDIIRERLPKADYREENR